MADCVVGSGSWVGVAWVSVVLGCNPTGPDDSGGEQDTEVATAGSSGAVAPGSSSTGEPTTATTTDPASSSEGGASTATTADESTGAPLLGPPYPILLAHGFFGFENLADLEFVPYWHGVPEYLAEQGELDVCIGEVDPFNDSTTRGEQLVEQAIECAALTGHAQVNIIAHSQGGLDARVVANLRPDLVASITTVATPHHGTPIADIAIGAIASPEAGAVVDWLVQLVGAPLWDEVGSETSLYASMEQMSTEGMVVFNEQYPDVEGVLYTSLTGRSGLHPGGEECEPTSPPPPIFMSTWDDTLDTIDPLFAIPEAILSGGIFSQHANDGLVRAADSHWGEFLGCVPADHIDEIGHLLGDNPGLGNDWDHLEMYAGLVQYLRLRDL